MGLLDKFFSLFEDKPEIQMVYCPKCFWVRASNIDSCEGCVYQESSNQTHDFISESRQRLGELDSEGKNGMSIDLLKYVTEHPGYLDSEEYKNFPDHIQKWLISSAGWSVYMKCVDCYVDKIKQEYFWMSNKV